MVLDALNARHSYQVHVVGETEQVDTVSGVNAVSSIGDDVVDLIAQVDLGTTAVGPVVLERIAPAIAKGLVKRKEQGNESPLNIIACENMVRGTTDVYKRQPKTVAHLQGSVNPATIVRHKYDQSPALAIHASGRLMTQGGYRVHHGV